MKTKYSYSSTRHDSQQSTIDDEPKPKLTGTESYKLNKTHRLPQA